MNSQSRQCDVERDQPKWIGFRLSRKRSRPVRPGWYGRLRISDDLDKIIDIHLDTEDSPPKESLDISFDQLKPRGSHCFYVNYPSSDLDPTISV